MPSYKLTYFDARGKAEVARYMFKLKDVAFEDNRVEGETWQAFKPSTPFGALPVMEIDGVMICQSSAIERLLAKRFGLYGKDDMEQARSDMVVGCGEDTLQALTKIFQGATEEEKTEKKKELAEDKLPPMLSNFEKMINSDGLFICKELMWADIAIAHLLSFFAAAEVPIDLSKYPKLSALKERVESQPQIAKWIKERKQTKF